MSITAHSRRDKNSPEIENGTATILKINLNPFWRVQVHVDGYLRPNADHGYLESLQKLCEEMSGRGKGGKGLGKGGAKRHRKVLRDNIQGKISNC
ncbi:hypothetical protein DY000_02044689 [Brassica cretica]|uniref:Uncharacterized protein n=1 Tax=Brassica cretica TaxID=69181 RepID=A0ABQ7F6Q1_BRACR|nr:hypothetical protein DY000_02044689 [Brassica cretica]